ncbi:MAG: aminodeoxychorismate synthase component I [Acidobacteria bacterium]|nr:aminodeoxychorismate synthase component I [Acidobacteriota bacterium]
MTAATTQDQVILHHNSSSQWLRFKNPFQVIEARKIEDVQSILQDIEAKVREQGRYAAGFISYEASAAFDPAIRTKTTADFPLLWFGLYPPPERIQLREPDFMAYSMGDWVPSINKSRYFNAISKIKEHIQSGDTYQVNYTFQLHVPFSGDPWNLFLSMVRAQNPGYAAWVDTGRYAICSASPELFFDQRGSRLICKPMKGTVKRGRTLHEDESLARWLHHSEKNRAENLMIVDMIRNDLGRVAEAGSVEVEKLFEVERHPTLWQMTSTIRAESTKSLAEIMAALFPCASITGAPKIRTTRIIADLEQSGRNIYTGCIGYIGPEPSAQFNVAIRTAVVDRWNATAEYGTGGGIVWDSASKEEYTEAILKARVLTLQQPDFSLLESLLWTPDEGYFLLEYHMKRLEDSARYFDYPADIQNIKDALHAKASVFGEADRKVRLLVDRNGSIEIQFLPLIPEESPKRVKVKIAAKPVNSTDIFLYHKTTSRHIYESARLACPDCDDVLLWNERQELTESSVANIVVEIAGELYTPPVEAGLLGGVFRAWLLEQGKVRERVLHVSDIKNFSNIYLINSVRKWQEAELFE